MCSILEWQTFHALPRNLSVSLEPQNTCGAALLFVRFCLHRSATNLIVVASETPTHPKASAINFLCKHSEFITNGKPLPLNIIFRQNALANYFLGMLPVFNQQRAPKTEGHTRKKSFRPIRTRMHTSQFRSADGGGGRQRSTILHAITNTPPPALARLAFSNFSDGSTKFAIFKFGPRGVCLCAPALYRATLQCQRTLRVRRFLLLHL